MFFELISLNASSIRLNLLNEIPQWVGLFSKKSKDIR